MIFRMNTRNRKALSRDRIAPESSNQCAYAGGAKREVYSVFIRRERWRSRGGQFDCVSLAGRDNWLSETFHHSLPRAPPRLSEQREGENEREKERETIKGIFAKRSAPRNEDVTDTKLRLGCPAAPVVARREC